MIWVILSILAGLGDAITFAYIKGLHKLNTTVKIALYSLITLPFLLFGFLFYEIPVVSFKFYIVVIINVFVWIVGIFLLMKSLEESDLSISIPMLSFTPIFLLFVSYILLREFPSLQGLAGIFIVVVGSYILNISSVKSGFFEPLKSIFKNKGVFYMLIVAFLFSVTASLSKSGINLSNPAYFIFIHYLFASIILLVLFFRKFKKDIKQIKKNSGYFFIIGVAVAFSEIMTATAFKLEIVPYVISLKRTSVIFSVLIGYLFLKEKNFKHAIIGSVIMFIGAVLITLS